MKSEFDIRITTGSMYRFLMYHTYHGFAGIFSVFAGIGLLVLYAVMRGGSQSWMYLLFGVLFLVYEPWTMLTKAAQQTKLNPVFRKPLHYLVDETGIQAAQDEAQTYIPWDSVQKVCETGSSILVYTGKLNATIWVKNQMGAELSNVKQLMKEYVDAGKLHLK